MTNQDLMAVTREQWKVAQRADFDRSCLAYRLRCAKRAIELTPLPVFVNAIAALEKFRDGADLQSIRELYKEFKKHKNHFGYTPEGETYRGLLQILYRTSHPGSFSSSDCQPFVEAHYLTENRREGREGGSAMDAQQAEYDRQAKDYKEIFGAHRAKWSDINRPKAPKAAKKAAVAA
jgi:hypothetical protein